MNAKDLLLFFAREYRQRYGKAYLLSWGKDARQARRLLDTYSADEAKQFVLTYLHRYRDNFHERAGKHFALFVTAIPALIQLQAQDTLAKSVSNEANYERLQRARAGTGHVEDRSAVGGVPCLSEAKTLRNGDGD